MKWLIDLQSLKIFAFATRHQCLHRVTLMSYTQHSNLLPLLTAEQGYLLEQKCGFSRHFSTIHFKMAPTSTEDGATTSQDGICFLFIF